MTSTELMSFATFLRNYDKAQQRHALTTPNTDAIRQRELMRTATDAVANNLRHRWNTRMDAVTVHPSTDKE